MSFNLVSLDMLTLQNFSFSKSRKLDEPRCNFARSNYNTCQFFPFKQRTSNFA